MSEQRDRNVDRFFALANDLLCIVGFDGTVLRANPALEHLLGRSEADLQRDSFQDYLHPEDREALTARLGRVEDAVPTENLAIRCRCADGAWHWLSWSVRPDQHARVIYAVGRDVTDRRQLEEKRRESEERQAFLLDLSDQLRDLKTGEEIGVVCTRLLAGQMALDRAYIVRFDAEQQEALVGPEYHAPGLAPVSGLYPYSSFPYAIRQIETEMPVYEDVANDERLPEAERQALLALAYGAWVGSPIRTRDKKVNWALYVVTTTPRKWTENDISLVTEAADRAWGAIERARAAQALRESQERLQLALNTAAMGTFLWYPNEDRGEPDARMLELFGLPDDGMLTLSVALGALIHPDDRRRYADAVARALDPAGPGIVQEDIRVVQPGAPLRWVTVYGQVLSEGTPRRPMRMAGMAIDITERKRAEEEREQARLTAEAAVRARDEFLSIASHELRNPIASVKATAQLMQRLIGRGRLDGERLDKYTRMIGDMGDRLTALVDDLLDVSRLQSGRMHLQTEAADLAELVRHAVEIERVSTQGHRLRLQIEEGHTVWLDAGRIQQVIVNLLDNAIKYSSPGGEVRIVLTYDDTGALLRVQDQGIGLPRDALESIFEPFGRAANAASSQIQGMGLGLFIARRIVQAHGGQLWAESEGDGLGTTMHLWLPPRIGDQREPSPSGVDH